MLAGEAGLDAGRISLGQGRPGRTPRPAPAARRCHRCATTSPGGLAWIAEIEAELAAARGADGRRARPTRRRSAPTPTPRRGSSTPAAIAGATASRSRCAGLGFGDGRARPPAGELLRRRADAGLAGPGARLEARPAAARRAHQPPRHRLARVARELPRSTSTPRSILVAHDRWFLESVGTSVLELEAGRARYFAGPWHAWRAEQAARELAAGRDIARREAEIARMERFVERFRYKATKARQAQSKLKADRADQARRRGARPARRAHARVLASATPSARAGWCSSSSTAGSRCRRRTLIADGELWLERGEHVCLVGANGSGKTTLVETLAGERELDAGQAAPRPQRQARLPLPAHRGRRRPGATTVLAHAQRRDRALGGEDPGPARPLPVLRRRRREAPRRHLRRRGPAPGAGAADELGRQPADPRRAHQPPRRREPRGARGRAHRLRRDGAADLPRPRAARGGRQPHDRDRGRAPAQPPRRLGRVPLGGVEAERAPRRRAATKARAPRRQPGRARTASADAGEARARGRGRPRRRSSELEDELADPSHWSDPERVGEGDRAPRARPDASSTS